MTNAIRVVCVVTNIASAVVMVAMMRQRRRYGIPLGAGPWMLAVILVVLILQLTLPSE